MEISNRLRNALVADLVDEAQKDGDPEGAERLIRERMENDREVTAHLARQLGFHSGSTYDEDGGIHETMMTLVPELRRLLDEWPLPEDGRAADALARLALKDLSHYEVYATLYAGPPKWRRAPLPQDCRVEHLYGVLPPILLRGFTSSLNEMLAQWTKWDVPKLYGQWMQAKRLREEAESQARRDRAALRSPDERRRKREDDAKWREGMSYTPPGRTT